jgi:peptidoglycan hydrolase-like protein with peptidoglycan-binding domain
MTDMSGGMWRHDAGARVRRALSASAVAALAAITVPAVGVASPAMSAAAAVPYAVAHAPSRWEPIGAGTSGERVRQVQYVLRSLGHRIAVDGVFGRRTQAAVRAFQASKGLRVDGIVGPATATALGLTQPTASATAPASTPAPAPAPVPAPAPGSYVHPNAKVERWHGAALAAGWPESEWQRLSCIIQRESGGDPAARNPTSSASGLLQIMWSAHSRWIGGSQSQLFDASTNLRLGRQIFLRASGWGPWSSTRSSC